MTRRTITIGTRGSKLALTQTGQVADKLRAICQEHGLPYEFELKTIVTKGDQILDVTLSKVGGKGLFVKEIEQELLDGGIDLAVHSMKDVPSELPEELMIGAVPVRVDPRDALITRTGCGLDELPHGALVGTSSLRRACQLQERRPDLELLPMRGNIDTRLRKLQDEGFDAIVLATAGLQRTGWEERVSEYLEPEVCLPAVGQGALGIECRRADEQVVQLLQLLNDERTERTVAAERAFLGTLNGGCQVPIAAYAVLEPEGTIWLRGLVGRPDGSEMLRGELRGFEPKELGVRLAEELIAQGADRILAEVREQTREG